MGCGESGFQLTRAAWALTLCLLGSLSIRAAELPAAPLSDERFFTDTVLPVLQARCFACHSHDHEIKGGLALDSRSGWVRGGDQGPAIVPGAPEESLLIEAISYTNTELQAIEYIKTSLRPLTTRIEQAMTDLIPRGQYARFTFESMLRADTLTRYQAHKIALDAGFLTVDEVRHIENLPTLDNSDTITGNYEDMNNDPVEDVEDPTLDPMEGIDQ